MEFNKGKIIETKTSITFIGNLFTKHCLFISKKKKLTEVVGSNSGYKMIKFLCISIKPLCFYIDTANCFFSVLAFQLKY